MVFYVRWKDVQANHVLKEFSSVKKLEVKRAMSLMFQVVVGIYQ